MILIDETYFTGELSLPNIPATSYGDVSGGVALVLQTVGESNLGVFVDRYVVDYLIRLFGKELATEFIDEIDKPVPAQIWIDMKDRLLTECRTYKSSPLANYVYFMVSRDAVTRTSTAGEKRPKFDFAVYVSNEHKLIKAWNDMSDMTIGIAKWYCENSGMYSAYTGDCTGRNVCSITRKINQYGI